LYPGLSPEFAFAMGGESKPGSLRHQHMASLAQTLGMRPQYLAQRATGLALRLPAALARAVTEVGPDLPDSAQALAARLQHFVLATTKRTAARLSPLT
jgi:serine/threonine-protein kinase HipA